MSGRNYQGLVAWQRAMDFVTGVYQLTNAWPASESFGLTGQIRRAVVSIPSNIAEGQGRGSTPEFLRFLSIAHGSLREVETQLEITRRLNYACDGDIDALLGDAAEVGRLIQGLMRRLRQQRTQ